MTDRQYFSVAKAVAYLILFIAAGVVLLRVVIGPLWGSASDLGMIGAVLTAAAGVLGMAWLGRLMVRDVARGLSPDTSQEISKP
ncbi:hypothetical protein ACN2C6_01265 [Caulobacter sp. ErkDOM-YI]|uniref:hypothetical protein n=1 Tax=unclassified Caulobacter TaxID=2648921 RepID=UPI003AF7817D